MSRTTKNQYRLNKEKPESISDFQALLDANKDKLSEGDYLALCNGMRQMFLKEEKENENKMIFCKVRTLTHEIVNDPDEGYRIRPIEKQLFLNLSKIHFDKLTEKISNHQMVIIHHDSHTSIMRIDETPCEDHAKDECDCYNTVDKPMSFTRSVSAETYITYIYPKEEWERESDLEQTRSRSGTGDYRTRWAITCIDF